MQKTLEDPSIRTHETQSAPHVTDDGAEAAESRVDGSSNRPADQASSKREQPTSQATPEALEKEVHAALDATFLGHSTEYEAHLRTLVTLAARAEGEEKRALAWAIGEILSE